MTPRSSVDTSLAQASRRRTASGGGCGCGTTTCRSCYFITVLCLLVFDVVMNQPVRGWAQGGVTAGLTVLFAVGFQADTRRHEQRLNSRRDGPDSGPGVDEGWIGATGGRLWDHMSLVVLLGAVLLLAAQLMDDPARNWTATIVLAVLSVLFVTGRWANHRRRAEQRN